MKRIRTGAAALNQTPLDWANNRANILEAIRLARDEGVSLLCLPELCITGYGCEDAFLSPAVLDRAWQELLKLAEHTNEIAVLIGIPVLIHGAVFNAAAMVVNGRVLGIVAKQNLAGDGLHYEPRWFKPWPAGAVGEFDGYPVGDLIFDLGGIRVGVEICEDAWVGTPPGAALSLRGTDIILNPSTSHFAFEKQGVRERFVLDNSRAFAVGYVFANMLGNEAGRSIYDGGTIIARCGEFVARGKRFSFQKVVLTTGTLDVNLIRMQQARLASRIPHPERDPDRLIRSDFDAPEVEPDLPVFLPFDVMLKKEEFARSMALGLFDYLRKSRSRGFIISLSGGADSSSLACLVQLSLELARQELGDDEVRARLGDWLGDDPAQWPESMLTCVYQATRNSSKITRNAAATLAEAIGARYIEWSVDDLVQSYTGKVEEAIGRELSWETDDIALQNIQARVRAPGVWMLANLKGALLLATSNRSEAAVGYATMDGDTCGGLSPLAGIDKAFLRQWLRWLQTEGAEGIKPVPALHLVNEQQPTAELRPLEEHQTDESDLMPYPVLDVIERFAIRDKRLEPDDVLDHLRVYFPDYPEASLRLWVRRFFTLWARNQWKRERYAPSFHLDDANLDPKTWCRFPILSGGFAEELEEMGQE